jgi:hypothetical protein
METIVLNRQGLYDLVWTTSLIKLSDKYALSANGIKKICKEFDIPIPENGYWMKLKYNKEAKVVKLENTFKGEDKIVLAVREKGNPINLDQSPLSILTKQIESDTKAPLTVPAKLTNPDPLIIQTKEYWDKRKKDPYYRNDKVDKVWISVENDNKDRALRFMDTFIKLLRYRGHTFQRDINGWGPDIIINGIKFPFRLREANKRIPSNKPYPMYDYIPTGIFAFETGEYSTEKVWKDGKVKLEQLIPKIVAKLEIDAEKEIISNEESRLWHIKYEEEKKIKEEIKKLRNEEVERFNRLVKLSEQYDKTLIIRRYIEAVKQKAINTDNLTPEKEEWINWANDKADWFDPLINKPDDILN